jgi:hypothetical protein
MGEVGTPMSLMRAKSIAARIAGELAAPRALVMPHAWRGLLADLAGELVELNQRLDRLEKSTAWRERVGPNSEVIGETFTRVNDGKG